MLLTERSRRKEAIIGQSRIGMFGRGPVIANWKRACPIETADLNAMLEEQSELAPRWKAESSHRMVAPFEGSGGRLACSRIHHNMQTQFAGSGAALHGPEGG